MASSWSHWKQARIVPPRPSIAECVTIRIRPAAPIAASITGHAAPDAYEIKSAARPLHHLRGDRRLRQDHADSDALESPRGTGGRPPADPGTRTHSHRRPDPAARP